MCNDALKFSDETQKGQYMKMPDMQIMLKMYNKGLPQPEKP